MNKTEIGMNKGTVLIAAGGTGGHLFPAEALSHELVERGFEVELATDERARKFANDFPAKKTHVIQSATLGKKNPIAVFKMMRVLFAGYTESKKIIAAVKPVAAVGFGGYPTLPPLWAATMLDIPSLLHEQNAVLGRANRMLAGRVDGIAVGFSQVGEKPDVSIVETGNPVRPMVEAVLGNPYPKRKAADPFRLVIFGGSQGARFFSEIMPPALALLEKDALKRLSILQQARPEDESDLKTQYEKLGVSAQIAPFFKNMPEEISNAHFVIARAGASSVTELAVIGRPSLLVPLPGSLDGDQANNAIAMKKAGGAHVTAQASVTPEYMAGLIQQSMQNPKAIQAMAQSAKKTGIMDAASRLADCVEHIISGGNVAELA